MPYEKQAEPISTAAQPQETKSPRYEYQRDDARSFSLQFTPVTGEKQVGCELKIS